MGVALIATFAAGSALADKPEWAGGGKPDKHQQNERRGDNDYRERRGDDRVSRHRDSDRPRVNIHFGDRERIVIREYYSERVRTGSCPPGLAKKGNGCVPPGQAKKWSVGRPLPRDVIFYDLPPAIVVELGVPPPGHRYVRVAADILLIAIGTGMVVDAIEDLGRM
ncbi:RcnB family protein [Aromatoleum anaerobium]|uniref:RcnB family protein n=1 Tax=Aromatoleum anaerobium TaxID=182180 RepID=A0ABX1PHC1_9RHOO|nr:RcnB family protein [Aromatoleum anaerobium]MCK0509026.1 RcnB family protein [Aromatoleum anaerobium]